MALARIGQFLNECIDFMTKSLIFFKYARGKPGWFYIIRPGYE
jgi:hypothetical protein